MEEKLKTKSYHYICHILPSFIFLLLFFCPIGKESISLTSDSVSKLIWTFKLPFESLFSTSIFRYLFYIVYFLPLCVIFLISSLFIKKNLSKISFIFVYISLSIYLVCSTITLVYTANSGSWFAKLPFYIYVFYFIELVSHISMSCYGIKQIKNSNEQYVEYKRLKNGIREEEHNSHSIKAKLNITIISTITIILFTFMTLVINRYKSMITEAVSDIGRAQAEQTSAVYDSAEGKYEKIASFFETQKVSNSYAESPYERIDIIITSDSNLVYLEKVTPTSFLPDYDVFAYTTGNPPDIAKSEKSISAEQAHEFVKRHLSGAYRHSPVYDKESGTCKYIYPITFARKNGLRLVGFSIVTYKQEVLMEPFFKTKVFVFSVALLFLYLAIIISLLLADMIVNPLLFLRMNVRKASDSIEEVLSGSTKVEASSVTFEDTINTKDEVKSVSTEIGNLISLIRGIMPYISFSTLKNAEKDSKKSTSRELCFLFTDIRGFTSLCEGLPPKDVVGILNHYLDIETEIILNNGGDIDKFVGDEMMAFFAGPKKEYNACKAAMEIRAAMRVEQQKAKNEGDSFISIGIGINTGRVVFGPVGSRTRMDFTSIGDTVNLASRLEGANKAYGSKSIITEAVYSKLHDTFICRELDFITVKGKTEPVRIYEILQKKDQATEKIHEIKDLFEEGLILYREQQWDEAAKHFNLCAKKYQDYPSIVFLDRIRHFKKSPPPADWNGVFTMKVK